MCLKEYQYSFLKRTIYLHPFCFAQGDKGTRLTGSCYCSLLTESYHLFERRQRERAKQQEVTMKPETQQYHQARDEDKATSQ